MKRTTLTILMMLCAICGWAQMLTRDNEALDTLCQTKLTAVYQYTIKTFGNRLYIKDPLYYAHESIKSADTVYGKNGMIVNGTYVNNKAHVYQALELK